MTATDRHRVMVIDDHPLFRSGAVAVIAADPRFQVVAQAGTMKAGAALASQERPDVAVIDLRLPDGTGIDLARRLREELPATRIVILTGQATAESLRASLEAGVDGYLLKTTDPDVLLGTLVTVLAGGRVVPAGLAAAAHRGAGGDLLSDREREVLRLLASGLANKQIARALRISEKTARNHVTHIYEKLGVHHRTDAVRYAIRIGLAEA